MGKKRNLKEHLVDDTLDLSLSDLQSVPVREIAAIPKATCLDLSSNQLTSLGLNFSSLTHLVKLDLARNQLTELPENFGLLTNLKYLDLYRNKLQTLPLSFCNLKNLRWLDLKENPLVPKMMQICGPCLDIQGCQSAAKNIVKFLSELNKEVEAEQLRKEAQRKKQMEKELIEQAQKKEPKKKKKKKNTTKQIERQEATGDMTVNGNAINDVNGSNEIMNNQVVNDEKRRTGRTWYVYLVTIIKVCLILMMVAAVSLYLTSAYGPEVHWKILSFIRTVIIWSITVIPEWLRAYLLQVWTLISTFVTKLIPLTQFSVEKTRQIWMAILADEKVQLFIKITKENFDMAYIKTKDIIVDVFFKFSSYFSFSYLV